MKLGDLTAYLETVAPLAYQEDYDNSGLLIGSADQEIYSALISLDCTEEVLDEAIQNGCQLIISHHPIVFHGLKKFTGKTYVERVVMKAIQNQIAIYAIHTNLDHVSNGVNARICEKLGLRDARVLSAKPGILKKLVTFCPASYLNSVRQALFQAGAGKMGNYSECSFNSEGHGTFKAGEGADPFVGSIGQQHREEEIRIEVLYPFTIEESLLTQLRSAHPYEEPAVDLYPLSNTFPDVGSGMIGVLEQEISEKDFLQKIKESLQVRVIRHTAFTHKPLKKVAVCGGAGSFLLKDAISQGADILISSDFKYHEFFDTEGKIMIADVGHFESEQFTQHLLFDLIRKKFPTFALRLTEINTNPINYFF